MLVESRFSLTLESVIDLIVLFSSDKYSFLCKCAKCRSDSTPICINHCTNAKFVCNVPLYRGTIYLLLPQIVLERKLAVLLEQSKIRASKLQTRSFSWNEEGNEMQRRRAQNLSNLSRVLIGVFFANTRGHSALFSLANPNKLLKNKSTSKTTGPLPLSFFVRN